MRGDDGVAELTFEVGDVIDVARAADLLIERLGFGEVVGVDAVAAHTDGAELTVAEGDGVSGAPALVGLHARGEEVDVGLEGRLERLVPIHDVGEEGQGVGVEGVEAGAHDVGDTAFVHEEGHLGIADGELAAVLDLAVLHGVTVREDAILWLGPIDDVDELFGEKVTKAHKRLYVNRRVQVLDSGI